MDVSIQWKDPKAAMEAAVNVGLDRAAERLLGLAVDRVPVDEGTLRASGSVHPLHLARQVVFDTVYATYQHEGMGFRHTQGQAKYLESAAIEHREELIRIIQVAVNEVFG